MYPFGSPMPGRKFSQANANYRYGFNGKEKDNEMYGEGNAYDYGMRIYDPRLGRFLSVDPLSDSYPWYTPYQFAGNKPIWCLDLDGLEDIPSNGGNYYSIQSLIDAAFKDIRVSEAIKRGERVELHQTYSVMSGGVRNIIDRRTVLSSGTSGSNISEVNQDGGFYENGALGPSGIAQTFNPSVGIFTPTPPVPEPPTMPQSPPNPPIDGGGIPASVKPATPKKPTPQTPKPQNPPKPKPPIHKPPGVVAPPPAVHPPPPPPTPDPGKMCFTCFNGSDEPHFKGGVKDIVNWLNSNPDYNLKITADGGSSTIITDTWKDKPWGSGTSYEKHTTDMFERLKKAINAAGGDGNRIIPQKRNADGSGLKYEAVKRGG